MVDIQSPTAEIRPGKKERKKKKPPGKNIMSAYTQVGHNNRPCCHSEYWAALHSTVRLYCIVLLSVVFYFNAICWVCCKFCDF